MDSMNLKDFRPEIPDFDADEENLKQNKRQDSASIYHEEINTLKIEKLSNRVTIISIIIPCLISAILVFAYLDMKERVIDVDMTKQNQYDRISQQLEEKLNALDVKIAKNRFDFDNKLPEFEKKIMTLEGQIAKLADSKADMNTFKTQFDKISKQVTNNEKQDKTTLLAIKKTNKQTLLTLKKNKTQFGKIIQQTKNENLAFKKEFNARLMELSDADQQIGELRKNLSLLNKKYKNLENESISQVTVDNKINLLEIDFNNRINIMDNQINTLNQKLVANILRLQKDIEQLSKGSSKSVTPKPKTNIDSSKPVKIKEKPLTQ
jgi:chromosome segregation ATPase